MFRSRCHHDLRQNDADQVAELGNFCTICLYSPGPAEAEECIRLDRMGRSSLGLLSLALSVALSVSA
jgi:hypothetical protein